MVGTGRFELPTPRTPSECSTRLSHVPTKEGIRRPSAQCAVCEGVRNNSTPAQSFSRPGAWADWLFSILIVPFFISAFGEQEHDHDDCSRNTPADPRAEALVVEIKRVHH